MSATLGVVAAVASAFTSLYLSTAGGYYAPDACQRVEKALKDRVMGQELATEQLVDAVCRHLRQKDNSKPLVISLHGPPGVGKTLTHRVLARALYGLDGGSETLTHTIREGLLFTSDFVGRNVEGLRAPAEFMKGMASLDCPGGGCPGYKVLYGMDFLAGDRNAQVDYFKKSVLSHVKWFREALLVVEEYDKLSCDARGIFRQLLQHPEIANVTMAKSIILLESNLGTFALQNLLQENKNQKGRITAEQGHKKLKDLIYEHWASSCEPLIDTLNVLNLVDFFLPYFPLGKKEIRDVIVLGMNARAREQGLSRLSWDADVVDFLLDKIVFEDGHPIDGGKEVDSVLTRHIDRALRLVQAKKPSPHASPFGHHVHVRISVDKRANAIKINYV